jgi:hypothetical protein
LSTQLDFRLKHSFIMPLTFTLYLSTGPVEFIRLVRLTHVGGDYVRNNQLRPKVHFTDYNKVLGQERSGVSIVVQDGGKVLFCAEHSNPNETIAGRWLYARLGYLHWKYEQAARAVNTGHKLEIYFSSRGNATQVIHEIRPTWDG